MAEPLSDDDKHDRVIELSEEFIRKCRAHERPTVAGYAAQFPELSDQIREVFPMMLMLERASGLDTEVNAIGRTGSFRDALRDLSTDKSREVGSRELPPDSMFGRYRIRGVLGRGGMGIVYRAVDTELDREVALKIPTHETLDATALQRFRREARSMATVSHRNLCAVYDAGDVDGTCFLSMACIEGRSLADLLQTRGQLANQHAAEIVLKLAEAMAAAHAVGIVHRDLKPANIIIDARDEPVITDFGLAVRQQNPDPALTRAGAIVGSPAYMSPEQVSAEPGSVGPATDIYSLGVILYELLSGRRPYEGTVLTVLGRIVSGASVPSLSTLQTTPSPRLEQICRTAMSRVIADRYASAALFADDLREYLVQGDPLHEAGMPSAEPDIQSQSAVAESAAARLASSRKLRIAIPVACAAIIVAGLVYNGKDSAKNPGMAAHESRAEGIIRAIPPQLGNRSFAGTTGNRFTVGDADIVITALGFEDSGNDGLQVAHRVAMWSETGVMLASVVVPAGTAARFVDGWRYVDVPPLTLAARTIYVLGAETTQHDDFFTDAGVSPDGIGPIFDFGPLLQPGSNCAVFHYDTFQFPTLDSETTLRWAAANAMGRVAVRPIEGEVAARGATLIQSASMFGRRATPLASGR